MGILCRPGIVISISSVSGIAVLNKNLPTRIHILDRIIVHIRVPVPRQGVPRTGDDAVRLGEVAGPGFPRTLATT